MDSRYQAKERDIEPNIGERIIRYLIGKYIKFRYKIWMFRKEANESRLNLPDLSRICSEHVMPVTSPLALISEMQGCGGALLSRLFDGHPGLYVHPHELMIGYPEEHIWPRLDLSGGPERWFEVLYEDVVNEHNREGYKKEKEDKETFPFVFISSLQKEIFFNYMSSVQSITMRDIFDGYMTSYFGAWLNNQNYHGSKKFITAYTPRLGIIKENIESFFEVYPDGRLISVVRGSKSWLASAKKRWSVDYTDVGKALSEWNKSAQAMLWSKKKYGDFVCLIQYGDIIRKTEAVMRFLAEFLTIEFDDILLVPTFNKFPIKEETAFKTNSHGVVSSLIAEERTLTGQELNAIEKVTSETYALVLKEVVRFE
jgi:hypothetical protein